MDECSSRMIARQASTISRTGSRRSGRGA
jgi:hypothetical protein